MEKITRRGWFGLIAGAIVGNRVEAKVKVKAQVQCPYFPGSPFTRVDRSGFPSLRSDRPIWIGERPEYAYRYSDCISHGMFTHVNPITGSSIIGWTRAHSHSPTHSLSHSPTPYPY